MPFTSFSSIHLDTSEKTILRRLKLVTYMYMGLHVPLFRLQHSPLTNNFASAKHRDSLEL